RHEVGRLQQIGRDDLDRDAAPGPGVAALVDGPHPALAEQANHLVATAKDLTFHTASDASTSYPKPGTRAKPGLRTLLRSRRRWGAGAASRPADAPTSASRRGRS